MNLNTAEKYVWFLTSVKRGNRAGSAAVGEKRAAGTERAGSLPLVLAYFWLEPRPFNRNL